ncbi:HAD family hydrolase [Litchfieldella xinjiangensis]|uniref:HAD family hydrolase n=1 Tax=Litchfieldella xinjiangensis TaxID=1166948 RepID=UPI0005BAAE60|nr:HAD family hydrolase [Halomonas xinjiangensis]
MIQTETQREAPVLLFDVFKTLVSFDGDHVDEGTFIHLAQWLKYRLVQVTPQALERCYRDVNAHQMAGAAGEPPDVDVRTVWDAVLAGFGVEASRRETLVPELALVYRQVTTRHIDVWPGTFEMLDACRGFRLAVASNTQRAYTEPELKMLGLWDRFEHVVFSSDVLACKPHPALFRAALAALEVAPADVVYVGDNPYDDVLGAGRLGIPAILLDRGTPVPEGVALPTPLATLSDGDPAAVARVARQHFGLQG